MDAEDPLTALHDLRLPTEAAGGVLSDVLAAAALGLLAGLLLVHILRAILPPRQSPTDTRAGPPSNDEGRRLALLRDITKRDSTRATALFPDLYRQDGLPDAEVLEKMRTGP